MYEEELERLCMASRKSNICPIDYGFVPLSKMQMNWSAKDIYTKEVIQKSMTRAKFDLMLEVPTLSQ